MINTGYSVNHLYGFGYRGFPHHQPVHNEKFTLETVKNETLSSTQPMNVEDIISNFEIGNKETINVLEERGLNYSLTEYGNGYKIKFEYDGNKYTVAYNGETAIPEAQVTKPDEEIPETIVEETNPEIQLFENLETPVPPSATDYLIETTSPDGTKTFVVDEDAYEKAMNDYRTQKAEYDNKINEINQQTAERQKQDVIDDMQKELDSFSSEIKKLEEELEASGTNSKIMTNLIHELSAEYEELLQRKTDALVKNADNYAQNSKISVPTPPNSSSYETDEEYAEAMNVYTYQKFLYDKQMKERELRIQLTEKRIEKMDEKLEQIRRLLFGSTTT